MLCKDKHRLIIILDPFRPLIISNSKQHIYSYKSSIVNPWGCIACNSGRSTCIFFKVFDPSYPDISFFIIHNFKNRSVIQFSVSPSFPIFQGLFYLCVIAGTIMGRHTFVIYIYCDRGMIPGMI